jgi:hypothetical protein
MLNCSEFAWLSVNGFSSVFRINLGYVRLLCNSFNSAFAQARAVNLVTLDFPLVPLILDSDGIE